MSILFEGRRYLTNFDSGRTGHIFADVLVIGGGVAGSRAAIEAARHVENVLLICKERLSESATRYAQGGIAAARESNDDPAIHIEDTLRVGCGLCRREAVEIAVRDAPHRIDELIQWGMRFDTSGGQFALTREGGHSVPRILHAEGDATGHEMTRVLIDRVRQAPNIRVFEHCFLIDLITDHGKCVGAVTFHRTHGHQLIWAGETILASGGAGRVYRETSNPEIATGDGCAAAYRAGVRLADLELVQFHPTTLYVAGANRALISEAVRGEGALLIDRNGNRFMPDYHADAELAPRDVVSRAIFNQMRKTRTNCVFLDARPIGQPAFAKRFPGIHRLCAEFQIDVGEDPIPVRPAAHYMIGGVLTELDASTSLNGLTCCGEAACSGMHGANRLASNSLLEGLVFGAIAGSTAAKQANAAPRSPLSRDIRSINPASDRTALDVQDIRNSLRSVMWRNTGIERCRDRLNETREILEFWGHYVLDKTFNDTCGWETQNMLTLGRLIAVSAAHRTQSIGVHWRVDTADTLVTAPPTHTIIQKGDRGPKISQTDPDFRDLPA